MKFAYFGVPHIGGTYSVFTALRDGLAPRGVEVRWLGVGRQGAEALVDPAWAHERCRGEAVAGESKADSDQAAGMIEHLQANGYHGVFANVLANRVQMNAVRYLPASLRRIMIVHNITPGTYAAARALCGHVHAAIGASPRIRDDLVGRLGFPQATTHAIPNAVDTRAFGAARTRAADGTLRLLFLGRVEDASKGVLWLPAILRKVPASLASLAVAGDGPDFNRLRTAFRGMEDRVTLLGRVEPAEVPALLARHDALLFPSRFEGLGLSLVEAMAAGCVPVASRIRGVTDFVVTHGEDGLLFPVGDVDAAAAHTRALIQHPGLLDRLSAAARAASRSRFSLEGMADRYGQVVEDVVRCPPPVAAPEALAEWSYPSGLRPGLRTMLPPVVKNLFRTMRER